MPRKVLYRTDSLPYHVTARANNRENFHLHLDQMWEVIGSECHALSLIYGVEFHALVLMPNHLHILLTVPAMDLGRVMNVFMSNVTRLSNHFTGRSGHVFGGPYFWSSINSTKYYRHALKYVYRNPVKGKLCELVEEYPFSTLYGLVGNAHLPCPLFLTRVGLEISLPYSEPFSWLDWLNTPFPAEAEKLIQQGLRKKVFDDLKSRRTRKPHQILEQFL